MENYIVINGKKAELTKEQMKQLGLIKDSPFDRVEKGKNYYSIDSSNGIIPLGEINTLANKVHYETANYCTNRNLLQQRAWHETLDRLLWRFSCKNGGLDIDWDNLSQTKYQITYQEDSGDFKVCEMHYTHATGTYFISKEIAKRAITEIIHPFLAEYPNFRW